MSLELNLVALGNALNRLAESLSYDASQPLVVDAASNASSSVSS